jgi:hypothetical protein
VDVHSQLPPASLSVSLNIMHAGTMNCGGAEGSGSRLVALEAARRRRELALEPA